MIIRGIQVGLMTESQKNRHQKKRIHYNKNPSKCHQIVKIINLRVTAKKKIAIPNKCPFRLSVGFGAGALQTFQGAFGDGLVQLTGPFHHLPGLIVLFEMVMLVDQNPISQFVIRI